MFRAETASPCEIDLLCDEDGSGPDEVFFIAAITVEDDGTAIGRIEIDPGEVAVNTDGTGTVTDSVLDSVDLDGTTVIDDVVTDVSLSCQQS